MARKIKNKQNRYKSRYLGGGIMRGRQYQMGGVNSETESKYVLDDSEFSRPLTRLYPTQRYKSPAWLGKTSITTDEHLRRQAAGLPVIGPNWRGMSQREDFEAGQKYGPILGTVGERIERHGPTWEDYAEVSSRRLGDALDYLNPTFLKEQQRQFPDVDITTGKIIEPKGRRGNKSYTRVKRQFDPDTTIVGPARRQTGGMYSDNTVQAAGQGRGTSTANIVFQEQDPELQRQRLQSLQSEEERLKQEFAGMTQEVKQDELQAKQDILKAQQQAEGKMEGIASVAKTGFDTAKKAGAFEGIIEKQAAKQGLTTAGTSAAGTLSAAPVGIAAPAAPTYGAGLIGPAAAPTTAATGAGAGAVGGTAATAGQIGGAGVGTGVGKFLSSGSGIGTVATLVGTGVKAFSEDDDPTKYNVGEVTGDVLSAAGTGASIGSMLGPVGTLVGGVAGGIYGGVKGLVGRNKARKAKAKYEAELAAKKEKYNRKISKAIGTQLSNVRAGEVKRKTYSGYDYGRNIVAQLGGMRMGMPRYGYAA